MYAHGERKGNGQEVTADGRTYTGEWNMGMENGEGTGNFFFSVFNIFIAEWVEGDKYRGGWVNGKCDGYGVFMWGDGRTYSGAWLNGEMHGFGVFIWGDGRKYEGDYRHGVKHGKGKITDAKGNAYDGMWKDGKQHGDGS
jgi:hypothetical protein